MNLRRLERTLVDQSLRVIRLPIHMGAQFVPNGDAGRRADVLLVVDQADARIRDALGRLLHDVELQEDARRRRIAADERARAIELRAEAAHRKDVAERELASRSDAAEQLRENAQRTAAERNEQVEHEQRKRKRSVRQAADKQETTIEQAHARQEDAADEAAKRERLRVFDEQADALESEADAVAATDEAQRLTRAAAAAKGRRKGTAQDVPEIREPDNSTVDDWFGQQASKDADVADEALEETGGDVDQAEALYEERSAGEATYKAGHPRPDA